LTLSESSDIKLAEEKLTAQQRINRDLIELVQTNALIAL
jgi:hypothetical protein